MNHYEEIKSLSKISFNFRKNKNAKSRWPADFQLRVLKLIENGYSPQALAKKLNIPVQTYYHWRRVWKNTPKKNLNFIEVPISDNLEDSLPSQKQSVLPADNQATQQAVIIFPNGIRIENVSSSMIERILSAIQS